MDPFAKILASLPGLEGRLKESGIERWLKEQRTVSVEGKTYFVLGGDRFASEAEAMLTFAVEHGLVAPEALRAAASQQPLPPDVEAVSVDIPKGDR
jgi:hypothetical protein